MGQRSTKLYLEIALLGSPLDRQAPTLHKPLFGTESTVKFFVVGYHDDTTAECFNRLSQCAQRLTV